MGASGHLGTLEMKGLRFKVWEFEVQGIFLVTDL